MDNVSLIMKCVFANTFNNIYIQIKESSMLPMMFTFL